MACEMGGAQCCRCRHVRHLHDTARIFDCPTPQHSRVRHPTDAALGCERHAAIESHRVDDVARPIRHRLHSHAKQVRTRAPSRQSHHAAARARIPSRRTDRGRSQDETDAFVRRRGRRQRLCFTLPGNEARGHRHTSMSRQPDHCPAATRTRQTIIALLQPVDRDHCAGTPRDRRPMVEDGHGRTGRPRSIAGSYAEDTVAILRSADRTHKWLPHAVLSNRASRHRPPTGTRDAHARPRAILRRSRRVANVGLLS
jgi:hypothetical protein